VSTVNGEQQGWLLDRLAAGLCPYSLCSSRGWVMQRLAFVVMSLTLPVALRHGPNRLVVLDMRVCDFHSQQR
jgi:hypothetical protein